MMRWVRRWMRRIGALVRGGQAHAEVEEEMRFHLRMEAEELMREGMDPEEARREAARRFGGVDRHREGVREARGIRTVEDLIQDIRGAVRGLRRSPGFAVVALVTLALGIGASTTIFSVVQSVLLRPLPYPDPDRLVRVHPSWDGAPFARLSPAEFLDLRELEMVGSLGAYVLDDLTVTGDGEPERVPGAFLSAEILSILGAEPVLGRQFTRDEDAAGADLALLGHGLWMRRYAGDPAAVGRTITINGSTFRIVGILGPDFVLPEDLAGAEPTELIVPLGLSPSSVQSRGSHFLLGLSRLPDGISLSEARARLAEAGAAMVESYPDDYPTDMEFTLDARTLADDVLGDTRPVLRVLVAAVGLLLLIACANVANLLLARSETRKREVALRRALGAGRGRLIRQLLAESLTLALLGAALGLVVATLATGALLSMAPPDVPRIQGLRVDGAALLFATALASVTGVLFGLAPALRSGRAAAGDGLRDAGRNQAGGRGEGQLRRALVVGQTALALVLVAGAGLLTRTLVELVRADPGYRIEGILTAELSLPSSRYPEGNEVHAFYDRLTRSLRERPGIVEAGAVSNLPLATSLGDLNFQIEGRETGPGEVSPRADWQVVTPGYLEALDIAAVRGRLLDERDHAEAPGAVLISETTARRYWPGDEALGARFRLGGGAGPGWVTVVGIVPDVAHQALDAPATAQMYLSQAQFRFWGSGAPVRSMDLVVRSESPPAETATLLREAVHALDPSLPVADVRTLEDVMSQSLARPRLLASLVSTFAAVALALAAVGIYGVTAYAVGRRTRELGIRLALGAGRHRVLRLVLRESGITLGTGVLLGLAGALLMGRLLEGLLFGVAPTDPSSLALAVCVLGSVTLIASLVPARRATHVDPSEALRAE